MPSLLTYFIVLLDEMLRLFLIGLGAFAFLPIITVAMPESWAIKLSNTYQGLLMTLLGRGVFLQRSNGGVRLKKSVFDPSAGNNGAEKIRIKGEERFFFDPKDLMSTFHDRPFGLAHEDRAVILDARTAFFGKQYKQLKRTGRWTVNGHRKAFFAIKEGMRTLVNIEDAKAIIQNPGSPGITDRIDSYAEKGQSMFNTGTRMQQMKLFIALGVGLGVMFLLRQLAGASVGGSIIGSNPIMVWF